MRYMIGVDLGGTNIRAVRLDREGQTHAYQRVITSQDGPEVVIAQIERLIAGVTSDVDRTDIVGIGIAATGPVDLDNGIALQAPTIAGWTNVPLRAILHDRTGLRVELQNDANAAALGEWRFGSGRGTRHMVYVTVSTGIGGGVIADGSLLLGRRGMAAEIGHMTILPDGPLCCCGNHGCWEALASGTALAQFAVAALADGCPSLIRTLAGEKPIGGAHVAAAAHAGDVVALDLMRREGEWLGIGMANLLHLYAPDRIVLGGGVVQSFDLLEPHIRRVMIERAMPPFRDIPFGIAELGDNAGLIGAASLLL